MSDRNIPAALPHRPTRRQAIAGVAIAFGGLAVGSTESWARAEEEISHTAESIHQEPIIKASRNRVYDALTDAKQFDKIVQLSGVMQAMHLADKPAEISRDLGGPFSLFGGYVTGRHVELMPNQRFRVTTCWESMCLSPGYTVLEERFSKLAPRTAILYVAFRLRAANGASPCASAP
jgi:hypothetical protein